MFENTSGQPLHRVDDMTPSHKGTRGAGDQAGDVKGVIAGHAFLVSRVLAVPSTCLPR